jgi:hypothetical protein
MIDEESDTPSTIKEALTSVKLINGRKQLILKCIEPTSVNVSVYPTKKAIKSKFVFKLKLNNDNKTYKHKVRMVGCGYFQMYERDND